MIRDRLAEIEGMLSGEELFFPEEFDRAAIMHAVLLVRKQDMTKHFAVRRLLSGPISVQRIS